MAKLPPLKPPVPRAAAPSKRPLAIRPGLVAPIPTPEGFMTTAAKMSLAETALALRDEQINAQVVVYMADVATNPELDAITAQVVADLQSLQEAVKQVGPVPPEMIEKDRANREIELIQTLKEMLGRIFRAERLTTGMERKLGEVAKRFARVFFESELHVRIYGDGERTKTMRSSEEALWHALSTVQDEVVAHIESYQYAHVDVKNTATEHFFLGLKELRNDFLARTTPELNTLIGFLNAALTEFFTHELPFMLGDLSWQIIKTARLGEARALGGYKISVEAFPSFRQAFERHFLEQLVPFLSDEMLRQVRESSTEFRAETIRFVAEPEIYSELCEIVSEAVYDMLYNDGFLDLPGDWRTRLSISPR